MVTHLGQQLLKNHTGCVIAVIDKNHLRLFLEPCKPSEEACLVCVTAGAVERGDLRIDSNILTEQPDILYAILEFSAERAFCLIANEKDGIFLAPKIVLQMVANTARLAHTAGRKDHLGSFVKIDLLGFVAGYGKANIVKPNGIDTLLD